MRFFACMVLCSLCTSGYLSAQEPVATIQTRLNEYREKNLQEKIYVHTDKNFYLAGEIIWFKLYYVEASSHHPLDISKVAYVEILDKDNKPVKQAKIALEKGSGEGSFYLPASVNSGNYFIRAYTNWMKNFSPDYYFEKPVTIVNSLKPLTPQEPDTATTVFAQFFPEGGNLVKNIESKVAFRVTDKYGKGLNFTGLLLNENNDTLARFQPFKFGMGSFMLTPAENHTYKAIITTENGKSIVSALPAVQEQGYVMQLSNLQSSGFTVTVTSTGAGANGQEIYLFIHTGGEVKMAEKHTLTDGKTVFTINKSLPGEGISQLTVFNKDRQPVCERLLFKQPEQVLSIAAESGSKQYTTRKRVQLSINTKTTTAVPADLSVAVYRLDSLQSTDPNTILSYLWLTSDLKGNIEQPGYYFSAWNQEVETAADNLMLVHGWRRFNWEEVLSGKTPSFEYIPEFDGHIITGTIASSITSKPLADVKADLSVPGTQIQFYTAASNKEGRLSFDVRDYYGQNEVIVQAENYADSNYHIDIANPFSEKYSGNRLPRFLLPESLKTSLTNYSIGMQVQNTYTGEKLSRFNVPEVDTIPFYGKPFTRYMLDDYVRFTTMEEVLREYVPDVAVRRYGGQYHLHVLNWEQRQYYQTDPLILLDGVYVDNQKIIHYDPLKVKKLEVVTEKYVLGQYVYDGIVSFTTYHGDLEDVKLDTKTVRLDYEGLQLKREFYSPVYETDQQTASRIPDFRNLLFWSPDLKTDLAGNAKVGFYTSDIQGSYVAVLQGIDAEGHAGSYFFTFDVRGN